MKVVLQTGLFHIPLYRDIADFWRLGSMWQVGGDFCVIN